MSREQSPPPASPLLPLDDVPALMDALNRADLDAPTAFPSGVLRVQLGYNPNSSSLGTSVIMLLWGAGAAALLLQAVGATLLARVAGSPGLPSPPDGGEERP